MALFILCLVAVNAGTAAAMPDDWTAATEALSDEIMVEAANGNEALRAFGRLNRARFSNAFVAGLAKNGSTQNNELKLKAATVLAKELGDGATMAETLFQYGLYCNSVNRNAEAVDLLTKAIPLFEQAGNLPRLAYSALALGLIHYVTGDYLKAISSLETALPVFITLNDATRLANACQFLGSSYRYRGDMGKALINYDKAAGLYQKMKLPVNIGCVYQEMGEVYSATGDLARAMEFFQKALSCYVSANFALGQGDVYTRMGTVHRDSGNDAKAMEFYEMALSFYVREKSAIGQGEIYYLMGNLRLLSGNNATAMELYQKALPFLVASNSTIHLGAVYLSLGSLHLLDNDKAKAQEYVDGSLALFRKAGMTKNVAWSLLVKAQIMAAAGETAEAAALYDEALSLQEKVRGQGGLDQFKKGLMEKFYNSYEAAALFMIENGFNDKAFRYAESMKARLFLDKLAEGRLDLEKGIDPELKKQRDALEGEISRLNKSLQTALLEKNSERQTALSRERSKKEAELEELKQAIRLKNPLYAQVEYPQPVSITVMREKVLKPDEALLEYLVAKNGVYCFVVSRDRYDIVKLPIGKEELEKEITALTGFIHNDRNVNEKNKSVVTAMKKRARRLYDALIAPVAASAGNRTFIIVPDGIIATLPFEILRTAEGYAIEKHTFAYVQSGSVLEMLRTHYEKSATTGFIGFGDPVYDYDNFRAGKAESGTGGDSVPVATELVRSGYLRNGGVLDRLPDSGIEVKTIGELFTAKGEKADYHLRLDAREEQVKSGSMAGYGYIHFSTHGILDDRMQALALSQVPGSKEDGFFTLGEIMNSRFNARLVVLSACQTGEGKRERGEGVTGLTRAVMYAGTPAAVVSLWSVSDAGTKELMVRLYSALLKEGKPPMVALRQAKLAMLRDGDFSHPFFWAAFILYGE